MTSRLSRLRALMTVRLLPLLALGLATAAAPLYAQNTGTAGTAENAIHNPIISGAAQNGTLSLTNPTIVSSGSGSYTASVTLTVTPVDEEDGVTVDAAYFEGLTLSVVNASNASEEYESEAAVVEEVNQFTFEIPSSATGGCSFYFKITGTKIGSQNGQDARSANTTLSASGGDQEPAVNSVVFGFGLGKAGSSGEGSAGVLSMDAKHYAPNLYRLSFLQSTIGTALSSGSVTTSLLDGKQVVSRVNSDSRVLTAEQVLADKYVITVYDVSQTNVTNLDPAAALRSTTVENPGSLPIAGAASDAPLYHTARWGKTFGYRLPIANGSYRVQLQFAELYHDQAGKSVFSVKAEGAVAIASLDPYSEAGARDTALLKEFDCTVADGELTLDFTASVGGAYVSAIRVVPLAAPTGPATLAINAGGLGFTSSDGTIYEADRDFSKGRAYRGGDTRMKVTIAQPASPSLPTQVYDFEWRVNPADDYLDDIALVLPGGLRKERLSRVQHSDGLGYDETRTLAAADDSPVSVVRSTYTRFPFGERQTSEVIDPDGAALTTTWTYGETADTNEYGELVREVDPSGRWQTFTYDGLGRRIKTVSRHFDSTTEDESANHVETITYSSANPTETRVVTVLGQEVSRTYVAIFLDGSESERWSITATVPGAAWDAPTNLVSKSRFYETTHSTELLRGKTKWTRAADDTVTVYGYAKVSGNLVTTRSTGAASVADSSSAYAGALTVTAGTRTTTTANVFGHTIAEETRDIASNLVLSDWTALTVDILGRPTLIGYGDGTTRTLVYRGSNASCGSCSGAGESELASEIDRNGVRTDYAYDALNRRTETTRLGVTEKLAYDAADRVVERLRIGTSGPAIPQQKTTYDLAGRVTSSEDALGNLTDYAYGYPVGGGLVITITHPAATLGAERGTRIETTHADGRTKEISGTAVSPVKYAYGTWAATGQSGEWTQEIKLGDANAETEWTKSYSDLAGRTVKMEYPATTGTVSATMAYNTLGQLIRQADPDGVQTLFAYNTKGEREYTVLDDDRDGVIDYAGFDRITRSTTEVVTKSGVVVRRATTRVWATDNTNTATTVAISEQDSYGNQSWQTDTAGATTSTAIVRTAAGAWTVTATAPDGSRQVQSYTSGRLGASSTYTSTSVLNLQTTYAYDAQGRLSSQTDARTGATTYTCTDRDEVLTVTTNNATETTTYSYDALGNQLTITRPDLSVTTNEYHLRNNQLKKTYGSQTYPVEYTYDLHGRMKTLTTWQNATSNTGAAVTTWNYDAQRGWLTQKLYADNTGPGYTYTDAGRLLTRTWVRTVSGSPLVTTYGYNNAGDLASTDYSDTTPDVAITYKRFGAQKTVTDATGTRTFTYTAALRPEQEQLPSFYGNRVLARSYQVAASVSEPTSVPGRSAGFTLGTSGDPDSDYAVTYGYDLAGRLKTVTDPNGTFTYGYVANSTLRHTLTGPVHVTTNTYEPHRDVLANVENKAGATIVSNFAYGVNSLGQRTQRANTGTAFGTTSTDVFTYNAKGEVTGSTNATLTARNQSYTYDDIGNRVTSSAGFQPAISYTADSLNAYTAIGSASPTYDADGNQTSTGLGQVYVWDAENRLVLIEPVLPSSGDKKQLNAYDGQSRRVRKQVFTYTNGTWGLTTDEKFIYDGWNVIARYDAQVSGLSLQVSYTWGTDLSGSLQGAGGVGGLLSAKDGSAVYHYTYDANGNVSEVLNSSGGIVAHYEYDAFGNTVASSGTYAATNVYRFSTKPLDSVSELYYYGFRYYNPSTGRWPSRDPLGERGGVNLYGMVFNNPISLYDLLGKDPVGEWINERYMRRWLWQTALWADNPTLSYNDGVGNTMAQINGFNMDGYYRSLVIAEMQQNGVRSFCDWKTVTIPEGNSNRQWDLVFDGIDRSDARFWLGSSLNVAGLGGGFKAKVIGSQIYIKDAAGRFRWHDRIDSNPSRNDGWGKQILESINVIAEALTGAPFNVEIDWSDNRPEERVLQ